MIKYCFRGRTERRRPRRVQGMSLIAGELRNVYGGGSFQDNLKEREGSRVRLTRRREKS